MEARIVAASGIRFASIKAGKFRRDQRKGISLASKLLNPTTLGLNARDMARVGMGVIASLQIIRSFKPEVIFLKGGFVCLPVGLAAHLLHVPYVIHESDVSPGLANRILSRWAEKIAVGFPAKSYPGFDAARLVYVGNPIRPEILGAHRLEGLAAFGLSDKLPVILVTGGSQGAAEINDVVISALPQLLERYQVIHQTGEGELARIKFELSRQGSIPNASRYHPFAFLMKEMPQALAAADVIIGRAGVGTISDSAALRKPTVLIPNNQMAAHQMANARMLARMGAVRVIDTAKLTPERLVGEVRRILDNPQEAVLLSRAIGEFARPEAAKDLARLVINSRMAPKPERGVSDE
jgi:UDP-N-acetylglucosamine--N-acetylmuramyl-(pentapeptide) pyrophosphoryl-undecaprenol N-acetylglucosamine transferase